ncbi:hypothetical protein PVL29_022264 [Vitis rotundifolia]|uniref:Transmembrane protein n=1 Tax=Vitis rotundifolia TaxID=103349 RepID=A0AA38YUY7_VITRO|nr:hypothetical protein PVL29_022264 [Vitis rotundifolia]
MLQSTPSPSSPSENPLPPPPSHVVTPLRTSQLVAPPPSPPLSPLIPATLESEIAEDGDDIRIRMSPVIPTEVERKLNWPKIIVTSCIASALVIAFQTRYPSSPTIVLSCTAFSLSLLCTIVDNCISSRFPTLRQLLSDLAIFFLVDGFLLVITNPLSIILKSIIWGLYFVLFLIVLVSKWLKIINH